MLENYSSVIKEFEVYVAYMEARIVGVLVLKIETNKILLDNVAVHPKAQGEGIGKSLMLKAEQRAIELGLSSITLYTHEKMTENIALYQRNGYSQTKRIHEHGYHRIYMTKKLN